jgi:hypothetical protein
MLTVWLLCVSFVGFTQDPHQAMRERGEMAMGFDQEATAHHFSLYDDGGAIDIVVKDASDSKNRDAIRSQAPRYWRNGKARSPTATRRRLSAAAWTSSRPITPR